MRALASHQCVLGSITGPGVICGLSLLLILFFAPRGFSPGSPVFPSPQKPTFPNSNSIWDCQALCREPLARVIVQALPVFHIKFAFTFLHLHLRQKEKPHGKKRRRLTAKRKASRQKQKPRGKTENLAAKRNRLLERRKTSRHNFVDAERTY